MSGAEKTATEISVKTYRILKTRVADTLRKGQKAIQAIRIRTCWETGRLIDSHIRFRGDLASYGRNVISRLARDLKTNKTHLYNTLEFYQTFPDPKIFRTSGKLGWSHFERLLSLNHPETAKALVLRAEQKKWSSRQLREEIRKIKQKEKSARPFASKKLIPQRGKVGVCRIVEWDGHEALDLGFAVYRVVRSSNAKRKTVKDSDLYTYPAAVERVIDGDTLWARLDLGCGIGTRQKLRLRGIDAPELPGKAGQAARAFLEKTFQTGGPIIVRTSRSDKYDRYLADIFVGDLFVNQLLLDQGYAVPV